MMSRAQSFFCLFLAALLGTGCGLFERRDNVYQESRSQPPLQVPDDLDRPPMDDALYIPDLPAPGARRADAGATASASG